MKRTLIALIVLLCATITYAQNDTTIIHKTVKFESEIITTKSGKSSIKYYAVIDGKYYDSSKTAMKRYNDIIRFGGIPNVAIVENKKKTNSKIIIL